MRVETFDIVWSLYIDYRLWFFDPLAVSQLYRPRIWTTVCQIVGLYCSLQPHGGALSTSHSFFHVVSCSPRWSHSGKTANINVDNCRDDHIPTHDFLQYLGSTALQLSWPWRWGPSLPKSNAPRCAMSIRWIAPQLREKANANKSIGHDMF